MSPLFSMMGGEMERRLETLAEPSGLPGLLQTRDRAIHIPCRFFERRGRGTVELHRRGGPICESVQGIALEG
jgi:hypothetical protein